MKTFYKGVSAVILTYDITDEKTYGDLDYWYKQISTILIMQRNTVKAKLLLCLLAISQIGRIIGKFQSKKDWNMLKKIKLPFMKFQQKRGQMLN